MLVSFDFDRWKPGTRPLPANYPLTTEDATKVLNAGSQCAERLDVAMSICIVDDGANVVLLYRMPHAMLFSLDLAISKAKTAASTRQTTHAWARLMRPSGPMAGAVLPPGLVTIAGGFPLFRSGVLVGGLGISGAEREDIDVASACITAGGFDEVDIIDALRRSQQNTSEVRVD
ncbi:GlcG/HbpS family heme-binding protein [Nocardioides sp. Root190]|uniref:GlcG/HbpS family heme-binding protein n=1 Tax=Nocardioides sp. Root190 TaxID=1736488 RepID=UPI000AC938A9|nr:heme-binding protein [Nocardioides sp. Root190]